MKRDESSKGNQRRVAMIHGPDLDQRLLTTTALDRETVLRQMGLQD